MSSSAITTQVAQLKIGSVQNQADTSSIYSAGVWSFKNSTALTSVTISDSGNVGIKTTPSAFGSYYPAIQAEAPSSFVLSSKANNVEVGVNYVADNTFTYRYVTSGQGAVLFTASGPQSNGAFTWATAPSGTAGNAITWQERMRINASGNLLVGKTVVGDNVIGVTLAPDGGGYFSQNGTINFLTCFNTAASAYRFYVTAAGQINATSTSITAISDASLKENVRDLETGLSQVLALKPRRFDWKEETHLEQKDVAGFIAQEVEGVLPELVYDYKYNETDTKKALKMGDMLPTLVKAIQEQQAQIEALKAEVAALKAP